MSSFPPKKWEVRYLRDMQSLTCEAPGNEIHMAAYMALKPAGGEEGTFRFDLQGPNKLKVRFNIRDVLDSPQFDNMTAEAELDVGDQIRMDKNSCCSPWVDIVDLIRSQDFLVADADDNDVADNFLANLTQLKSELQASSNRGDMVGISLRWMLGTEGDSRRIILFAQVTEIIP